MITGCFNQSKLEVKSFRLRASHYGRTGIKSIKYFVFKKENPAQAGSVVGHGR